MYDRILLVDLVGDTVGHYCMMESLSKVDKTVIIDTHERKIKLRKSPIKGYVERYRMLYKVIREVNRYKGEKVIVHFLTGDKFYGIPLIKSLEKENRKIIANIHSFPDSRIQRMLLKNFSNKITTFVATSDYERNQFVEIGINNVVCIPWPSFYDYSGIESKQALKKKMGLDGNIVITALGGIRFEKGLDILLTSFKYLSEEEKEKIVVNIVGKPYGDLDIGIINGLISENNIRVRCIFDTLTEKEFCENVVVSDIMAIPYRKSFRSGASGPLIEAMSQGIPCIFPEEDPLGYYSNFDIGITFKSENPVSLADAIRRFLKDGFSPNNQISSNYTQEGFIANNLKLYKSLF